jgi:hypothetical protein
MEMFMKESGNRIKLTEEADTYTEMGPHMKVTGLKISNMALG